MDYYEPRKMLKIKERTYDDLVILKDEYNESRWYSISFDDVIRRLITEHKERKQATKAKK